MIPKEKYFFIDNIQNLDLEYIKKTKANLILKTSVIKKNDHFYKFYDNKL